MSHRTSDSQPGDTPVKVPIPPADQGTEIRLPPRNRHSAETVVAEPVGSPPAETLISSFSSVDEPTNLASADSVDGPTIYRPSRPSPNLTEIEPGAASPPYPAGAAAPRQGAEALPAVDPENYEFQGEFARGGLGRIVKARDKRLGRPVALKELIGKANQVRERFLREAIITARLQHPSIVPIYEAGRWPSGEPFYAMKLVNGKSLLDVVSEAKTLEQRLSLLPHMIDVCEAVAYAHSERIIHRDLKPENILIGSFGETVVIDWGIAKDLRDEGDAPAPGLPSMTAEKLTMEGTVMGTPAYMSLEQAMGKPVDERADVYSLGVILYFVLSGCPPYTGENSLQILNKVLEAPPPPLSVVARGVPRDLRAVVEKAMARDPKDRYPTALELAEELKRFQLGQFVKAYEYSRLDIFWRFIRRHGMAAAVVTLLFATLVFTVVFGVKRIIQERDTAEEAKAAAEIAKAVAQEAQAQAELRSSELTLIQAENALDRDPTASIAWLKALPANAASLGAARIIASEAKNRGVAKYVLPGHEGVIWRVIFSPDGKTLASASQDNTVRIWDTSTGKSRTLTRHEGPVTSLAFSPDGSLLASASQDNTLCFWEVRTPGEGEPGKNQRLSGHIAAVLDVAFSPDGSLLASASQDGTVRLWKVPETLGEGDLKSAQALSGHVGEILALAFSPDGKILASAGKDKTIRLWDVATGEARVLSGHRGEVRVLAFSPDGKKLASAGKDKLIRVWDLSRLPADEKEVKEDAGIGLLGHGSEVTDLAFSPDGKKLASTGQDSIVKLWNISAMDAITSQTLRGHEGRVYQLAFSPDGAFLASAGHDATVRLWDIATGQSMALQGHENVVSDVAFSPDSQLLASAGHDNLIRIWAVRGGDGTPTFPRVLLGHDSSIADLAISPDGTLIASASSDTTIRLWTVRGAGDPTSAPRILAGHAEAVSRLAFSPNGNLLASASRDRTLRIWDVSSPESAPRVLQGHAGAVLDVAFAPGGKLLASAGADQTVRVWEAATGAARILEGHRDQVLDVEFSPDGKLLASTGKDKTVRIWDVATGKGTVLEGHDDIVYRVKFSPDGKLLASAGKDKTIRLWDISNENLSKPSRSLVGHSDAVSDLTFSPDGALLISAGLDAKVRVWVVGDATAPDANPDSQKSAPGRSRVLGDHGGPVYRVEISPDGKLLASTGKDKSVRLWDISTGQSRSLIGHREDVFDVEFSPDSKLLVTAGADKTIRLWDDDLPKDPEALHTWIKAATTAEIARPNLRPLTPP